jgi:hypothetical protein
MLQKIKGDKFCTRFNSYKIGLSNNHKKIKLLPAAKSAKVMPMLLNEPNNYDAWRAPYHKNPYVNWYLLAEDDTIVVHENLPHAIQTVQLGHPQHVELIAGLCAGYPADEDRFDPEEIPFVIGGASILLSHLQIAMKRGLGLIRSKCDIMEAYSFTNKNILEEMGYSRGETTHQRIISMHEKDPHKIKLVQD